MPPPKTSDPYSSNKPAPIGQAQTGANFYAAGGRNHNPPAKIGNLNQQSSNSLFGGDSTSVPVRKPQSGTTNIVADDDDDWDKEEPTSSNIYNREGMGFFNRPPATN